MADKRSRKPRTSGAAPTLSALHEAALAHLARYAATEAGLRRVLERRVMRWARAAAAQGEAPDAVAGQQAAARQAIGEVVARLAAAGGVDDAAFAAARARRLTRGGHSRRAVAAHLAARGIAPETARAALPDDAEAELAAALALAHRRRIGPFRTAQPDPEALRREYGVLARAGFPQSVAARALRMDAEQAELLVLRLRRA